MADEGNSGESDGLNDPEGLICFCHCVTRGAILQAIQEGAHTVHDIQEKTRACTGCGGCEPEILDLLEAAGHKC